MKGDLRVIKNKYGENMAKLCRSIFPDLFESPGLLPFLLLSHFDSSRMLYDDLIKYNLVSKFRNYIYSLTRSSDDVICVQDVRTPEELLDMANYDLYECKSEVDIQRFRKYYKKEEELCTFNGGRLNGFRVFFAVKKNVDSIKREDFLSPSRDDEYGTSVISIQFTKDDAHILSIKNRYNHTVTNPDSTFGNNLDNIIPGLTEAFGDRYGLVQRVVRSSFEIPGYVVGNDGKYYKYNYEFNNIFYCSNNVILNAYDVKKYPKEKYIVCDYFVIDLVNKKVSLFDDRIRDSFVDDFVDIKKIVVVNEDGYKKVIFEFEEGNDIIMVLNSNNCLVKYYNSNALQINSYYLSRCKYLEDISLPNVEIIRNSFLHRNNSLVGISIPNVKFIGDGFLYNNKCIRTVNLPSVSKIGNDFLYNNNSLSEIYFNRVFEIGNSFLYNNDKLSCIMMPNVHVIGDEFLYFNSLISSIGLDNVRIIGNSFLYNNICLSRVFLPRVEVVGNKFIYKNKAICFVRMDNVKKIGNDFLFNNDSLTSISLPNVLSVGNYFLYNNLSLMRYFLPEGAVLGSYFCDSLVKKRRLL